VKRPLEYWTHRIRMAKAMGCNAIAAYVFWNHHETAEGLFDFATGNRDLARFLRLVQAEGLWVILRPGPYVCAEWDLGGSPRPRPSRFPGRGVCSHRSGPSSAGTSPRRLRRWA
jgi:beta-galactosidase GanA